MKISKIVDGHGHSLSDRVYITRRSKDDFKYIVCSNLLPEKPGDRVCPICLQKKKLQAHHVVPKRVCIKNQDLKELRIHVCKECHSEIHLENYLMKMLVSLSQMLVDIGGQDVVTVDTYKEALVIIEKYENKTIINEEHRGVVE